MKKQRLIFPVLAAAVIAIGFLIGVSGCAKHMENESAPAAMPEEIDEMQIPVRTDDVKTDDVQKTVDPVDLPTALPSPTEAALYQSEPTPGDPTDHQPVSSTNPVETAETRTPGFNDPTERADPTPSLSMQEGDPSTDPQENEQSEGDPNEGELDP